MSEALIREAKAEKVKREILGFAAVSSGSPCYKYEAILNKFNDFDT
jgi:hypothetical protein